MKIKVSVSTNKVGSKSVCEFDMDDADWMGMSDEEKDECCMEAMFNMIEWNWEERDE